MTDTQHSQNAFEILQALQPIYRALVSEFVIEVPACPLTVQSLDGGQDSEAADPEFQTRAEEWFQQVDRQIQVHQLRQFLQTTPLASELVLRNLIGHQLRKPIKSGSDRDKIDFLLVQYFSLCTPAGVADSEVDLKYVAQVLEPVLGAQSPEMPDWLAPLEGVMQSAARCRRLSELLHGGTLDQGRKLKSQAGDKYFDPAVMAAFARFSFMIRRTFFRLMHDDLNAIQDGLRELDRRGIHAVDCRRAQFSDQEPTARLRMICQSWKVMFHAEYSSGHPLRMLVDLRAAVDDALQGGAGKPPAARAAAASSESDSESTSVLEE
ncbi:MAG: hypothetical protein WA609_10260 [Terriglobales bacterium]